MLLCQGYAEKILFQSSSPAFFFTPPAVKIVFLTAEDGPDA
jgi:hypothetical protein